MPWAVGGMVIEFLGMTEILFSSTQSVGLAPRREVPSIIPYSSSRPADIYLPFWSGGRPAAMDVTVISPLQKSTITASFSSQGAALMVAETRKNAAHLSNCRSAGVSFLPLAVKTLGCWSRDAVSTIRSIGHLQALRLGLDPGETISHLFQRLSVALWRGNAQMWCSRFPIPPPSVDGVI